MTKQANRGFNLHGFNYDCLYCCCSVCTGRRCPYHHKTGFYKNKCYLCYTENKCTKTLECDFFENKYTVPRHFKVKRRWREVREEKAIEKKLDVIIEKLGIGQNNEK